MKGSDRGELAGRGAWALRCSHAGPMPTSVSVNKMLVA